VKFLRTNLGGEVEKLDAGLTSAATNPRRGPIELLPKRRMIALHREKNKKGRGEKENGV